MASSIGRITREASKKIEKVAKAYAKAYTEKATELLLEKTTEELDRFYSVPESPYYHRTGNLLNNSYKPIDESFSGLFGSYAGSDSSFIGGVSLSADYMDDYCYLSNNKNEDFEEQHNINPKAKYGVMEYDFGEGMHGPPWVQNARYTTPSPYEALVEYFNSSDFDAECGSTAIAAAERLW